MVTTKARIFRSGNSQAVRLPKELAYPPYVHDLIAHREGDRLVLEPAPADHFSDGFWSALGQLPGFKRPEQVPQRGRIPFP